MSDQTNQEIAGELRVFADFLDEEREEVTSALTIQYYSVLNQPVGKTLIIHLGKADNGRMVNYLRKHNLIHSHNSVEFT